MIRRLEHIKTWSESTGGANLGRVPATQADLDHLRTVINGLIDVINALIAVQEMS